MAEANPTMEVGLVAPDLRISGAVQETGLSKELIHHDLRKGLLPQGRVRDRYTSLQARLLRWVRRVVDDWVHSFEAGVRTDGWGLAAACL